MGEKGKKAEQVKELKRFVYTTKERSIFFARSLISKYCSALALPRTVSMEALDMYRKLSEKGKTRGLRTETACAALVYLAAHSRSPRTAGEVAAIIDCDPQELYKIQKRLSPVLGARILPASAKLFLPRYASILGLEPETETAAAKLLKRTKLNRSGKILAAAALYLCSDLTQKQIASRLGLSIVSLRETAQGLSARARA